MNTRRSVRIARRATSLTAATIPNFCAYGLHGFASNATTKPGIPQPHSDYRVDWPIVECLGAHACLVISIFMAPTIHLASRSRADGYAETDT